MPARPATALAPYLVLAGLWLLLVTIVPPRANFPLNDDWIYAKIVKHLAETGEYRPNVYGDPTFILQAYWGAAFVKVFGFSFDTLRVSSLLLGIAAVWATYWCAIEAGLSRRWAFLCGITQLANPMFMNLSYTFMTDVPVLALSAVAIAGFLRAQRTGRLRWLWYANLAAVGAFFVRQFGMLVPIAYGVALIIHSPRAFREKWPHAAAAMVVPWAVAFVLMRVLPIGGEGLGGSWDWNDLGHTLGERAVTVGRFIGTATLYLALFCVPLLLCIRWDDAGCLPRRLQRRHIAMIGVAVMIGWLLYSQRFDRPPWFGNVFYDLGVGALLLPWTSDDGLPLTPLRLGNGVWNAIDVSLAIGAAYILVHATIRLVRGLRLRESENGSTAGIDLFLALTADAFILVLILPAVANRFDRYFLGALVPLIVLAARVIVRERKFEPRAAAFAAAAVFYIFGVCCLQDYLAWNRARWQAAETLQSKYGAPIEQINGGYEFNGWHHSDYFVEESLARGEKVFGPKGWWIRGDEFRVFGGGRSGTTAPGTMIEQPFAGNYVVLEAQPYFTWLGFQRRELLLLRNVAPPD